jgi:drug/metabolite transporter (DMT)-like permease
LLAALAGIILLGERPGPAGITGIVLVVLGVLVLGAPVRGGDSASPVPPGAPASPRLSRAIVFALVTGTFIASYTLWDKYAVSTLRVPPLIQGYASLPVMALVLAPSALRQRARTARVWRGYRRQVTGAAVLSPLAYILVLIAMSFTAVSAVAPAREVSVLAGVLLGRRLLGEGSLARRLTAAAAIAAGIICIAVG